MNLGDVTIRLSVLFCEAAQYTALLSSLSSTLIDAPCLDTVYEMSGS